MPCPRRREDCVLSSPFRPYCEGRAGRDLPPCPSDSLLGQRTQITLVGGRARDGTRAERAAGPHCHRVGGRTILTNEAGREIATTVRAALANSERAGRPRDYSVLIVGKRDAAEHHVTRVADLAVEGHLDREPAVVRHQIGGAVLVHAAARVGRSTA